MPTSIDPRATPTYEFDAQQNQLIGHLARRMVGAGLFQTGIGIASLVAAVLAPRAARPGLIVPFLLAAVFFAAIGVWSIRGGRAFRRVVQTEGQDIELTMHALAELDRFYSLCFWLAVGYLAFVVLSVFAVPSLG